MATIVADYVLARPDASAAVILVGDLNDGVDADGRYDESYRRLIDRTAFVNAYQVSRGFHDSQPWATHAPAFEPHARRGRMIDHVLVSSRSRVRNGGIDRTLFTAAGEPVDCPALVDDRCPNGTAADDLRLYSDHWAVWADLKP
jgi:endonuclease/exonuclease/phosphatase family metal-dependent hydrolase